MGRSGGVVRVGGYGVAPRQLRSAVRFDHSDLDEDGQVDFKGKAKGFLRAYGFLSCILPYSNADWERRSIFLNFLIAKLRRPRKRTCREAVFSRAYDQAEAP